MQSRDFAFWLNGFFELGGGADGLTKEQVELIKTHLALVFEHDTSVNRGVGTHPAPNKVVPNEVVPKPFWGELTYQPKPYSPQEDPTFRPNHPRVVC